jgi:hypothetical protein
MAEFVKNNEKQAKKSLQQNNAAGESNDTVEISAAGAEKANKLKEELEEMSDLLKMYKEQAENARQQGEAIAESIQVKMRCLTIASRIMFGDKVPAADYRYLAQHDLELYAKAVSLRTEAEKPKKHKRLSEEEKQETAQAANEADPNNETQAVEGGDAGGSAEGGSDSSSGETTANKDSE